ncbi:MAG: hypothetical protein QOD26_249 [Betaproteobacteria bacterium]|jgi:hypothetical protein|nr:hypothetical protein [Betaproteobacteria bacterium]
MRIGIAAILASLTVVSLAGCERAAAPAAVPAATPVLRHQADATREQIWLLTRDGVSVQVRSRPGRTLVELPGWVWASGQWACPPDLALGPNGEAVVTSNVVPTLWKINPETLAVTVHPLQLDADLDKDIGFSELVYSKDEGAFLAVSDTYGARWKIDAQLATARKVSGNAPLSNACRLRGGA